LLLRNPISITKIADIKIGMTMLLMSIGSDEEHTTAGIASAPKRKLK
jgi:hypothetical protein